MMLSRKAKLNRNYAITASLCVTFLTYPEWCIGQPNVENTKQAHAESAQIGLSSNEFLFCRDTKAFQPGASLDTIFAAIQWRGDFQLAGIVNGKVVSGVMFILVPSEEASGDHGKWIWAIFVDRKFVKFVPPPKLRDDELEKLYDKEYKRELNVPRPSGMRDLTSLARADESSPIDASLVCKQLLAEPDTNSHSDPGLTAVFLALKPSLSKKWDMEFKKNSQLRNQFNASRLRIGMTEDQVASIFEAAPLESGNQEGRAFRIFGSNDNFDIVYPLHFANVLVVFDRGKVSVIRTIPAGHDWHAHLSKQFSDLPELP